MTFLTFLNFRSCIGVLGPARCLPRPSRAWGSLSCFFLSLWSFLKFPNLAGLAEGENHIIHKGPCHIYIYIELLMGITENKMETTVL